MQMTYTTHTVKKGEHLTRIARDHGWKKKTDWKELYGLAVNAPLRKKRPDPDHIEPGDTVLIPIVSREELKKALAVLMEAYDAHCRAIPPIDAYKDKIDKLKKAAEDAKKSKKDAEKQAEDAKKDLKAAQEHFKYAQGFASQCKLGTMNDHLNPFVAALLCKRENDEVFKSLREMDGKHSDLKKAEGLLKKKGEKVEEAQEMVRKATKDMPNVINKWRANHEAIANTLASGISEMEKMMGDTF